MSSKRPTEIQSDEDSSKKSKLSAEEDAVVRAGAGAAPGLSCGAKDSSSDDLIGSVNPEYTNDGFKDRLIQNYRKSETGEDTWSECGLTVHKIPFKCCELKSFIRNEEYLKRLKADLENLKFFPKNNDLYKFHQSGDLKSVKDSSVECLRKIMYTDLRAWLETVTDIRLNDTVDMSCSVYRHTDTLLCHDDELEGRRIAFIFYLVPPWTEEDGGSLDLFSVDDNNQPVDTVKRISPEWNKLVFFEVTPVSFHQVSEVIAEGKCRLSVSGWFHGPPIDRPEPYREIQSPLEPYLTVDEQLFYQWINPQYLDINVQAEIQDKFEAESEIELQDFINPQMYESLVDVLKTKGLPWMKRGPANKRCYYQLDPDKYPSVLVNCVQFFRSDAMFVVLSNLTGLSLHELAVDSDELGEKSGEQPAVSAANDGNTEKNVNQGTQPTSSNNADEEPCCRGEVRCWRPGCYTLMADTDINETAEFALDARYFIGCSGWLTECGGYTSYIVKDEDEELLTVNPFSNSLALVYRDRETLQFVKHINHTASLRDDGQFYDLSFVYYEKNS